MPNTLAHIGVQSLITRGLLRDSDLKWIWAGCVLPDLPWIAQRLVRALAVDLSPFDLRLYAIVQSSLALCLVLAAALACLSRRPGRCFAILALGSGLHLLLDATQTKWANGVVLLAPLDWRLLNFGLYWPENVMSYGLTALGLGYAALIWVRQGPAPIHLPRLPAWRWGLAAGVLLAYGAGPLALMPGAAQADLHFITTLRDPAAHPGAAVGFDRSRVVHTADGPPRLAPWTGQMMTLTGPLPRDAEQISLRGVLSGPDTIALHDVHVHRPGIRDWFSYIGLALVAGWWGHGTLRAIRSQST